MASSIPEAPKSLDEIVAQERLLELPDFTVNDAWILGLALRATLTGQPVPCVINITSVNSEHVLFHTVTGSGTTPDQDEWIRRKRKTVMRWGYSSWWMHVKMDGDENAFRSKYMLGDRAGEYAIHGGAVPVRVRGVEGIVAVCAVSGLRQEEDHMVVVEALRQLKENM